jgi:hypothetical protein
MFASKHPSSIWSGGVSEKFNGWDGQSCRTSVLEVMQTPSAKGARAEAKLLAALVAAGKTVLLPWGAHHRYDFVLDEGDGRFTRVQCKSGVYRFGCIYFRTASADRRRPNGDSYHGQIDAFAVYCHELDESFLVPILDVPARQLAALRVDAPLSNQRTGIRWARPYALAEGAASRRKGCGEEERKTGFEPAAPILARSCATTAPLPLEQLQ